MTTGKGDPVPLTVEMAQRMYTAGKGLPETSKDEIRERYEVMAVEARTVMSERLTQYTTSVARLCLAKRHVGSTPAAASEAGTPCPQCRKQIRYMRTALKVVAPSAQD